MPPAIVVSSSVPSRLSTSGSTRSTISATAAAGSPPRAAAAARTPPAAARGGAGVPPARRGGRVGGRRPRRTEVVAGRGDLDGRGRTGEVALDRQERAAGVAHEGADVPLAQAGPGPPVADVLGRPEEPPRGIGEGP